MTTTRIGGTKIRADSGFEPHSVPSSLVEWPTPPSPSSDTSGGLEKRTEEDSEQQRLCRSSLRLERLEANELAASAVSVCTSDDSLLHGELTTQFALYRQPICRYLGSVFGLRTDAEEIVQEVFLRLCRYRRKGGEIDNVASWVFRVAHNLAISQARRPGSFVALDAVGWEERKESIATSDLSPEQQLLLQERDAEWNSALEMLTPRQRECLHLRAEGLRYRDIAATLGISIDSVVDALERAIGNLRKTLIA